MRVSCASGSRPAQISPSATQVLVYLEWWWPQLSPPVSASKTESQHHNLPPPLDLDNKHQKLTSNCPCDKHRIESHPVRWCSSSWLLTIFVGIVIDNPPRKLAGRQLFLCLPGRLNINNRATWRRVHRRNGAPMRKARLFTTWVSGAGETIQSQNKPVAHC